MALQRRTCHELLIGLGYDTSPLWMSVLSTVLVTALDALSPEAKADIVQHLEARRSKRESIARFERATPHMCDDTCTAFDCNNSGQGSK